MKWLPIFIIGMLMTRSAVSETGSVVVIGFGGGTMQYKWLETTDKRSWHYKPLISSRLNVVRYEKGRIEIFGVGKGTNAPGLWESVEFGDWEFIRAFPSKTMELFTMGKSYGGIECEEESCTLSIYDRLGLSTKMLLLPSGVHLKAKSQPVWRESNRTILFTTIDNQIAEFKHDDSTFRILTDGIHPRISSDGSKLAFMRGGSIWIRELHEEREKKLISSSVFSGEINQTFFWSEDGRSLYVNFETGYFFGDGYACTRINVDTGNKRRVWKAPIQCEAELNSIDMQIKGSDLN